MNTARQRYGGMRTPSPDREPCSAYSYPRVIHRSEESPEGLLPAASVNNSAAEKSLAMNLPYPFPCTGKHAPPGYEFVGWALDAFCESFEPGGALVLNEHSVTDRYKQVSL